MKKNNWMSCFVYAVVLLCYIVFSNKILIFVNKQREMTYQILPLLLWSLFIFVILGLMLGSERLILESRKEGSWNINLPKVVFLGVPSLYLSLGVFIYFCPTSAFQEALTSPISFFLESNMNFLSIFQLILGYVISSSLIKVEDSLS